MSKKKLSMLDPLCQITCTKTGKIIKPYGTIIIQIAKPKKKP